MLTLWEQFRKLGPFLFQHDCTPMNKPSSIKSWMSEFGVKNLHRVVTSDRTPLGWNRAETASQTLWSNVSVWSHTRALRRIVKNSHKNHSQTLWKTLPEQGREGRRANTVCLSGVRRKKETNLQNKTVIKLTNKTEKKIFSRMTETGEHRKQKTINITEAVQHQMYKKCTVHSW